jgi:hypothetical protein
MKKDYERMEELIERFFEGQTSNKEEQELYAFFSDENIPEHLTSCRQVFAYFESGAKEEDAASKLFLNANNANNTNSRKYYTVDKNKKIWASIAASILLLISFGIYHFAQEKEYNPYEGSYIIRNGVKITDPKIVIPEIEKTIDEMVQQEREKYRLYKQLIETNKESFVQIALEIRQQQLKWIQRIENEYFKTFFLEIINDEM